MNRTVRAGGVAAAAMICAAGLAWGDPLQADQGQTPTATVHYLEHAGAGIDIADIGLNAPDGDAAEAPAGAVAEAPVAAPPTIGAAVPVRETVDHLFALADAAMPRPRALHELVHLYAGRETEDREQDCLANAVYFEARGEPIEGQLAVAEVVLNRTRSGRYPSTICEVVTQPWQFSFVRHGIIPAANRSSEAWSRAVAVARIAEDRASRLLPENVLWYHADYVSPSWGRRLARNTKIGLHIFYS